MKLLRITKTASVGTWCGYSFIFVKKKKKIKSNQMKVDIFINILFFIRVKKKWNLYLYTMMDELAVMELIRVSKVDHQNIFLIIMSVWLGFFHNY